MLRNIHAFSWTQLYALLILENHSAYFYCKSLQLTTMRFPHVHTSHTASLQHEFVSQGDAYTCTTGTIIFNFWIIRAGLEFPFHACMHGDTIDTIIRV